MFMRRSRQNHSLTASVGGLSAPICFANVIEANLDTETTLEADMKFPEIITRLPEAALQFPSSVVKTSVVQSENGQLVFFDILKDVEIPPHSHKAQWGTVLEGHIELTIDGKTETHRPENQYFIPSGVVHSVKIPAGTKVIDFFEEKERYKLK
jgi:quercetin dioxygenase-like cupin family protein